jgi:hypothetical protein
MSTQKTLCLSVDCPERTGGKCWSELGTTNQEIVREFRVVRKLYEQFESDGLQDTMEDPPRPYVTWRGWKLIRNVITDRIEEITGSRV